MSGLSLTGLGTDFSIDNPRQVGWLSSRTLHMIPLSSNATPQPIAHRRPTVGKGRGTSGKGRGKGQEKDGKNIKPMKEKGSFKGKERADRQIQNLQNIPQWHGGGGAGGGAVGMLARARASHTGASHGWPELPPN